MTRLYFIAPVGGGPIKIGTSDKPAHRLITLAAWSPYPLEVLAEIEGGHADEAVLHELFSEHRSHSEWFRPHPDILALIKQIGAWGALPFWCRAPEQLPRKTARKWANANRARVITFIRTTPESIAA